MGDLRQAIASLSGVATLARMQGVGPRALKDLLPELQATCEALPKTVAAALVPATEVVALSTGLATDAHATLDALVTESRDIAAEVLLAIEGLYGREGRGRSGGSDKRPSSVPPRSSAPPPMSGISARARLRLEATCASAVERMAHVRWAIELLQRASLSDPTPVSLEELVRELDQGELDGPTVAVTWLGALSVTVAVQPLVAMAVLQGALGRCRQRLGSAAFAAFAAVVSLEGSGAVIELRARRDDDPPGTTIRVWAPEPMPYDDLVLRLAAATMAAPVHDEPAAVRVELLRV